MSNTYWVIEEVEFMDGVHTNHQPDLEELFVTESTSPLSAAAEYLSGIDGSLIDGTKYEVYVQEPFKKETRLKYNATLDLSNWPGQLNFHIVLDKSYKAA